MTTDIINRPPQDRDVYAEVLKKNIAEGRKLIAMWDGAIYAEKQFGRFDSLFGCECNRRSLAKLVKRHEANLRELERAKWLREGYYTEE